jgi:hypothetical protein
MAATALGMGAILLWASLATLLAHNCYLQPDAWNVEPET